MNNNDKTISDIMKMIVLGVSSLVFVGSVAVQLFSNRDTDTGNVTYVFIVVAGLVFGSNVINLFKHKE